MSEEWSPAAPDLGQHFDAADQGGDESRRSYSTDMVTADQLSQLESQRNTPACETHLRPGGPGVTEVHRADHTALEGQITHVSDRLSSASDEMHRDFERSRNFDRGRGRGRER